jgi:hypothetical protein
MWMCDPGRAWPLNGPRPDHGHARMPRTQALASKLKSECGPIGPHKPYRIPSNPLAQSLTLIFTQRLCQ